MFKASDVIPNTFWPAGWTAWWTMFLPALVVALLIWAVGIPGSGWLICAVVAVFVYLATGFYTHIWKVLMRAGMALSIAGFLLLIGAAVAASSVQPSGNDTASTLALMRNLALVPFMVTGMAMCTLAGVLALFRTDG